MPANLATIGYQRAAASYQYSSKVKVQNAKLPDAQSGKQQEFYDSKADVVIYGGSAGSGKSFGLLLDFARPEYISNPGYRGVIFRRLIPSITAEGGIWDTSDIYRQIGAKKNKNELSHTFPSGARVRFAGLQYADSVEKWDSSQITCLGFEELDEFEESQFFYMLSRNRSTCGIQPKCRATTNPNADSWLAKFIAWWIDPISGYPISDRSGVVRYFVRVAEQVYWADTKEELEEQFGAESYPISFTFISASVFDNRILLEVNPQYLANLKAQHPVEYERLLKGNWKVKYAKGTVFDRVWFKVCDRLPPGGKKVRFWDFAATAKEVATNTSCYTSGLGMAKVGKDYYIFDNVVEQRKAGDVEILVRSTALIDGQEVKVRWEKEGGSSGLMVENNLKKLIQSEYPNFDVAAVAPQGDKLTRALPGAQMAANGNIYLVRGTWNNQFLNAVEAFDGSKAEPPINDIVDSFSGAYNFLSQKIDRGVIDELASVKKDDIRKRR